MFFSDRPTALLPNRIQNHWSGKIKLPTENGHGAMRFSWGPLPSPIFLLPPVKGNISISHLNYGGLQPTIYTIIRKIFISGTRPFLIKKKRMVRKCFGREAMDGS